MCGKAIGKLFGMSTPKLQEQQVNPTAQVVDNSEAGDTAENENKKRKKRMGFDSTRGTNTILGNAATKDTLG